MAILTVKPGPAPDTGWIPVRVKKTVKKEQSLGSDSIGAEGNSWFPRVQYCPCSQLDKHGGGFEAGAQEFL